MNRPQLYETELASEWIVEGGRTIGDATCVRIEWLMQSCLVEVADSQDDSGWETVYREAALINAQAVLAEKRRAYKPRQTSAA